MQFKKDVVLGILASGFLIGISVKYLLECYYWGYSDFYKAWYYPALDFMPVLLIGFHLLLHISKIVICGEAEKLNA